MLDHIIFGIARFIRGTVDTVSNIVETNTNIISTILSTTDNNASIVNDPNIVETLDDNWVVVSLGDESSFVTKS
ncbi:hypothetical protein [Rickettsia oklahomensis]|uniref:Uncharacterized protein n=1 Tax=Rickettsia oklahomensis TaxID=3141789 RepID=A0AAU7BZZ6_9RICK